MELKLERPLMTISGNILKRGSNIKLKSSGKYFKVTCGKKSYIVDPDDLADALIPKDNMVVSEFVDKYTKNKSVKKSRTKIAMDVKDAVGEYVTSKNRHKAVAAIDNYFDAKPCPRCGTPMIIAELANKIKAWNCPNDRVTLPYEV